MSRHHYVDDLEPWVLNLYRANVWRSLRSKRGQEFLREMAAAMDAMPVKELITGELVADEGCCAIGSVCQARGLDVSRVDPEVPEDVAAAVGISRIMAAEIEYINDDYDWSNQQESPATRWQRVRTWIEQNLSPLAES